MPTPLTHFPSDLETLNPKLHTLNSIPYIPTQRADEAEDLYKKALKLTPHDSNLLNNYALFLQEVNICPST